jgi:hypothetical protein
MVCCNFHLPYNCNPKVGITQPKTLTLYRRSYSVAVKGILPVHSISCIMPFYAKED